MVATSVENLWTTTKANVGKIQLMEAMWLGCGSHGMKVSKISLTYSLLVIYVSYFMQSEEEN